LAQECLPARETLRQMIERLKGGKAVARTQDIIFRILSIKPLSEIDDLSGDGKSNLGIDADRCAHLDIWKELRKIQFCPGCKKTMACT
jgi:hypothetical protein